MAHDPASDFGLAVTCGPATNVQIATKEGVTTGHPAWLEIESYLVTGNDQIAAGGMPPSWVTGR